MSETGPQASSMYKVSPDKYSLTIVDHIQDNVYGHIGLTQVEKEIERLPIFKRLTNVSQLGVVNWVFPCAVHTRYVHSLGVMQMAYDMAVHINMNYAKEHGEPFFRDGELQIIRLAGMLHDIGHYPFSHNIEAAYQQGAAICQQSNEIVIGKQRELVGLPKYLMEEDRPIHTGGNGAGQAGEEGGEKSAEADASAQPNWGDVSDSYHHEKIGREIITNNQAIRDVIKNHFVLCKAADGTVLLNSACAPVHTKPDEEPDGDDVEIVTTQLLAMIASMVTGDYANQYGDPNKINYEFQRKYSAMLQLIHSDMDADNLDYLLHDATFSGTSYGMMDVSVLLDCLTVEEITLVGVEGSATDTTRYLVGVLPKGIGCVEQFFQNKYLAYSQMIFHKYVSGLEAMLLNWAKSTLPPDVTYGCDPEPPSSSSEQCGKPINKTKPRFLSMVGDKNSRTEYIHYTDAYIMRRIYDDYIKMRGELSAEERQKSYLYAVLSKLVNFSCFELEDECACVGFGEDDVRNKLFGEDQDQEKKYPLFQEYKALIETIKNAKMTTKNLFADTSGIAKKLFAFRFESYSMTKEVPFEEFCEKHIKSSSSRDTMITSHYQRLAEGVPILPKKHRPYKLEVLSDGEIMKGMQKEDIPELIVDSDASCMHKTWNQKLVYLRKYKIEAAKEPDANGRPAVNRINVQDITIQGADEIYAKDAKDVSTQSAKSIHLEGATGVHIQEAAEISIVGAQDLKAESEGKDSSAKPPKAH